MNEQSNEFYEYDKMSISELNLYFVLLQEQYNKVYTENDFNEIIEKMKYEFNIKVSINQLNVLFDLDLYEENLSNELIYRNVFS